MTYLKFANLPKAEIDQIIIQEFLSLTKKDERVFSISCEDESKNLFDVETAELSGKFSMGSIANSLVESKEDRAQRLAIENESLPDIINIKEFRQGAMRFSNQSLTKLHDYAMSLEPSANRAQCYTISLYRFEVGETISERFVRDHVDSSSARRHAQLLVEAGCANEIDRTKSKYGKIVFEDGSTL